MKYLKLFENFDEETHEEEMCSRCECKMNECDCPAWEEEETYESKKSKKEVTYKKSGLKNPGKADLDKNKKISGYEKARGKAIEKSIDDEKPTKLTAAQKRLPEGLRKAIEAKKRK